MIRLQRVGRKNDPSFRLVVTEKARDSQSGKFVEILGSYNARHGQPQINTERAKYWLGVGAQASGTAHNLLVDAGVISGKKVNVLPSKRPIIKEGAPAPESAPVEVPAAPAPAEEEPAAEASTESAA